MLHPEDAIEAKELCSLFRKNMEGKSGSAISEQAARLAGKHNLSEYPDPGDDRKHLYSKKEAMAVWMNLKPLTRKAA